jgi:hypothetical protein
MIQTTYFSLFYTYLCITYITYTFYDILCTSKNSYRHFIHIHSLSCYLFCFYWSVKYFQFHFGIRLQSWTITFNIKMLSLLKFNIVSYCRGTWIHYLYLLKLLESKIITPKTDFNWFLWYFYIYKSYKSCDKHLKSMSLINYIS